jgi:hypothetical protein
MSRKEASAVGGEGGSQSEVKAVVHRGPDPWAAMISSKTLDGQTIKHHESHRANQYHLGPYDTIKPSRIKRQSSGDSLAATRGQQHQHQHQHQPQPPPIPVKPSNLERKRDSFEGHEEAVRTLVEAVQESRKMEAAAASTASAAASVTTSIGSTKSSKKSSAASSVKAAEQQKQ